MSARAVLSTLLLVACTIPGRYVDERAATADGGSAGSLAGRSGEGTLGGSGGAGSVVEMGSSYADPVTRVPGAVVVSAPQQVPLGFGSSLAAAPRGEGALLWVGGAPLVSTFAELDILPTSEGQLDVSVVETPATSPSELYLTGSPAALPPDPSYGAVDPRAGEPCFASGAINGFFSLYCRAAPLSLRAPRQLVELLAFSFEQQQPTRIDFGSEGSGTDLLVTAGEVRDAWYLSSTKAAAAMLTPPVGDSGGARKTTTILQLSSARVLAVGLPNEGRVRFYRVTGEEPSYWGCWQGDVGFGVALAAGQLQPLPSFPRSLVVASKSSVHEYNGKLLLDPNAGCVAPPAPIASYTCGLVGESACPESQFGAALAVGDLDGDQQDELVIGTPQLRWSQSPGEPSADGGVLVVRGRDQMIERKQLDPPLHGGELGTSLTLASVGEQRVIVAGAPKAGKIVLFH